LAWKKVGERKKLVREEGYSRRTGQKKAWGHSWKKKGTLAELKKKRGLKEREEKRDH